MGTRLNPGQFDCYAAALADEEQFILNARDPAFPETIRYWITLRQAMIGRGEKPTSDDAMLVEASACAARGVAWRSENKMVTIADPLKPDDLPFVGPRWHYEQPPETREDWERAWMAAMRQAEGHINRLSDENASLRVALAEQGQANDRLESQDVVSLQVISRLREEITGLRGHIADLEGTVSSQGDTIFQVRAQLASCTMERDRQEEKGPKHLTFIVTDLAAKIACGLRQVATDMTGRGMRDVECASEQHGYDLEAFPQYADRINGYAAELEAAPGWTTEREVRAENAETISDLAEPPPINDHRFGHLEKHGDYAYARGLAVAPRHLPEALHQMEHEFGWKLLAIFGATDTQSIGFIFKRVNKLEEAEGFSVERIITDAVRSKPDLVKTILWLNTDPFRFHTGGVVRPSDKPLRAIDLSGKEAVIPIPTNVNVKGLHPSTAKLVVSFANGIAARLLRQQREADLTNQWELDDWEDECRRRMYGNLQRNDKFDAAALLAFMWARQWSTTERIPVLSPTVDLEVIEYDISDEELATMPPTILAGLLRERMVNLHNEHPHCRPDLGLIIGRAGCTDLAQLLTQDAETMAAAIVQARQLADSLSSGGGCGMGRGQEP